MTHDVNDFANETAQEIAARLAEATPDAATRIRDIADTASDKATVKAARRALYLLSQRGIVPMQGSGGRGQGPDTPNADAIENPKSKIENLQGWASAFDGAGNQMLLLALPGPPGTLPVLAQALLNDEEGLRDWGAYRRTRRDIDASIAEYLDRIHDGIALAEIEPDYARWLIRAARDLTRQRGQQTPPGFLDYAARIGEPARAYPSAPVYARVSEDAIRANADISRDAADLFAQEWFDAWFLPAEEAAPWIMQWEGSELLNDAERLERQSALVTDALPALFDSGLARRYARRLEDSADVLLRRDQTEAAQQALYHALTLRDNLPLAENSFVRTLVQRTVEAAVALDREARLQALYQGRVSDAVY